MISGWTHVQPTVSITVCRVYKLPFIFLSTRICLCIGTALRVLSYPTQWLEQVTLCSLEGILSLSLMSLREKEDGNYFPFIAFIFFFMTFRYGRVDFNKEPAIKG
ncbi:hypothetical protein XELAEV_18030186mg [Xenopus laevis]|uniref:Uncharacterized protein n=1 Tax=Xenopus laevis TaxID=8355 RepID=A0A974CSY1_XENLA|nr:hypothetical protein XELAEV_18030186mg [Xenopus laevis]